MRSVTVLYDADCALCRRAKAWLHDQPKYVEMRFVAAASEEARRLFPFLDHAATLRDVTVVGDGGEVYTGAKAWVVCLWALRRYRRYAASISSPALMPAARRFVHWVTTHRGR